MSVTYVGATYDEIANTDSSTILTQHASTQVHDVIIAIIGVGGDIIITPTEETSMGWVTLVDSENDGSGDVTMGIYWTHATVAGAGDTHQFDLSASGNSGRSYLITLRNCSIAGTISDTQTTTSTDATPDIPAATGDYDDWNIPSWECWALAIDVADGGSDPAGAGYPSGYTGIYHAESSDKTNPAIVGAAYKVVTTKAVPATTFTIGQAENAIGAHIIVRPHARFEQLPQDNYNLDFSESTPSGKKRIRWAVLGPIPQQPTQWCNMSNGGPCRFGINIEYMMESGDSALSAVYYPDWRNFSDTSDSRDILDEEDAQASPVYTFPVDLYSESYLSSDTGGQRGVEFSPVKTSQADHVMWMILRIDFTYTHNSDITRVFNVMASFIYDDTSQLPFGEYPMEMATRSPLSDQLYVPDYPVSAWHVRKLVMSSLNRLISQALPRICIPVFGDYEAGP